PYRLSLWHGLGTALLLSGAAWAVGLVLFLARERVVRLSRRVAWPTADRVYGLGLLGLERLALQVTGFFQRGSLPVYLSTVLLVMLGGLLAVLAVDRPWHGAVPPRLWDSPAQGAIAVLTWAAALMCLQVKRRMKAVVMAGLTGYGTALLFVVQGAPDLALTQFAVETVSLLVLVLVMRRMPVYFQETISPWRLRVRVPLALALSAAVAFTLWVVAAARRADPAGRELVYDTARHGVKNVVATILVEYRAWDTLGESAVLAVAAVGVTSLIYFHRRTGPEGENGSAVGAAPGGRTAWSFGSRARAPVFAPDDNAPERTWLAAGRTLAPEHRSVVFEVVARLVFHPILVLSVYLLFCAENLPGGGFVGGLVAGTAVTVRYLAGGRFELGEAAPWHPGFLTGCGLVLSTGVALFGLTGGTVLDVLTHHGRLPLLGDIHIGTPVLFDAGVYLLVLGVVLDVVRSLGARVDRQIEREAAAREAAAQGPPPRRSAGPDAAGAEADS
ncbi:hydrogen gas-evolving membrane-bound hydrogenase subunit E, partial [Streptomyces clavuligerus]